MIRVLTIILSASVLLSLDPASSSEVTTFYDNTVSKLWTVRGSVFKEQDIGPTCTAETRLNNGSYVHLSKDIDQNLYFLWVHNTDWHLNEKELVVRLDFYDQKGSPLSYASLRAIAQDSSSLDIPIDNPKAFLERFMISNQIQFTVQKRLFRVIVDKPAEIFDEMGKCVDAWETSKGNAGARPKNDFTGEVLALACGSNLPDSKKDKDSDRFSQLCNTYINGWEDALFAFGQETKPFCPPAVTVKQMSIVFFDYLASHKEERKLPAAQALMLAFKDKWPCR